MNRDGEGAALVPVSRGCCYRFVGGEEARTPANDRAIPQ